MYLCRKAVLVQAVVPLVAADAGQLGEAEAAADSGKFGLGCRHHRLTTTDTLLLMDYSRERQRSGFIFYFFTTKPFEQFSSKMKQW